MPPPLYATDKAYIRPLDSDVAQVFSPAHNTRFANGQAMRWLLQAADGQYLGRIAAFFQNTELSPDNSAQLGAIRLGSIGFFECINLGAAAGLLLAAAEAWLAGHGANVVQGPVNFGERDKWWGLLINGFVPPTYGMAYNPPYYRTLWEQHGYQDYFKQYTYYTQVQKPLSPIVIAKGKRLLQDPAYTFRHIERQEIDAFAQHFRTLYNRAWASHTGVVELTQDNARDLVAELKQIMDHRMLWFGFYNGVPISFFVMLPDVNQIFKKLNGQFGWWQKLQLFYYLRTKSITGLVGVVYGVVPEQQGKGVESAMVYAASMLLHNAQKVHYRDFEMNWIGDFNPKMMKVAQLMGGTILKTHVTYRKMLDTSIPFLRCAEIK